MSLTNIVPPVVPSVFHNSYPLIPSFARKNNSPLEKVFTQNWPQQENFTRLFALGIDAYHLISNLDYLENKDFAYYDGQTGNIQLDQNNRITRKLLWAKFERGKPVYFEPPAFEPALTDSSNEDRP